MKFSAEAREAATSPGVTSGAIRETAEMIAKFRTHPRFTWGDLANDIETFVTVEIDKRKPTDSQLKAIVRMCREAVIDSSADESELIAKILEMLEGKG